MPGYEEALTAFAEARSLLARAEDAMQNAVQAAGASVASHGCHSFLWQGEQSRIIELRRDLTEARARCVFPLFL